MDFEVNFSTDNIVLGWYVGTEHPLEQLVFASWTRDLNFNCLWEQLCPKHQDIWRWTPECNVAYFWQKSYKLTCRSVTITRRGEGRSVPQLCDWSFHSERSVHRATGFTFTNYILCLRDPRWVVMKALGVWRCTCLSSLPNTLAVVHYFQSISAVTAHLSRAAFLPCPWGSRPNLACMLCSVPLHKLINSAFAVQCSGVDRSVIKQSSNIYCSFKSLNIDMPW